MSAKPVRQQKRRKLTSGTTPNRLVSQSKNQPASRKRTANRMATSPRKQLKALRQRAGLSNAACAKALELAGATSYQRYESAAKYDTDKYRYGFIQKLMPLFVGRGSPPITEDEMLAISELTNISHAQQPPLDPIEDTAGLQSPTYQPPQMQPNVQQPVQFAAHSVYGTAYPSARVKQRYQIEPGTFYNRERVFPGPSGVGNDTGPHTPMFHARNYPPETQFGVYVYPGVSQQFGKHGAHILCVEVQAAQELLSHVGSLIVAAVAVPGNPDLFAVRLLAIAGGGTYKDEAGAMVTSDVVPLGACLAKWQIMLGDNYLG